MILVSRNIRYSRDIREGSLILGEGRQTTVGCIEERNFHCLLLAICTETIDRIYNTVYTALRRLSNGPKCMTLNEPD